MKTIERRNTRELMAQRAEVVTRMDAIDAAHPGSALPEAEKQQWTTLKGQLDGLDAAIDRSTVRDQSELRMRGTPIAGSPDRRWDEMIGSYSLAKAMLYASDDREVDAGKEREASKEVEKRRGYASRGAITVPHEVFRRPVETRAGQVIGDPALGGVLNPSVYHGELFTDRLRPASALGRLGVTWLTDVRGQQVIPKLLTSGTVTFVDENEPATASDATFGSITLDPKTAAMWMRYSRRALINTTPSIDALLTDDITKQIGAAIDRVAIAGDGAKEPLGLLNMPGLAKPSLGTAGGVLTPVGLIDLTAAPDVADALVGGEAWLMNAQTAAAISKLQDGAGLYMFLNTLPNTLLGYPVVKTSAVPADLTEDTATGLSALIFGAWASMVVCLWSGIDLLRDPFTQGSAGQVQIYAFQDLDVDVRHLESFAAYVDVKTS